MNESRSLIGNINTEATKLLEKLALAKVIANRGDVNDILFLLLLAYTKTKVGKSLAS